LTSAPASLETALFDELDFLLAGRDERALLALARRPYALQGLAEICAQLDPLRSHPAPGDGSIRRAELAAIEAAFVAVQPTASLSQRIQRLKRLQRRWGEVMTHRMHDAARARLAERPRRSDRSPPHSSTA
jgi:hypothetical protein